MKSIIPVIYIVCYWVMLTLTQLETDISIVGNYLPKTIEMLMFIVLYKECESRLKFIYKICVIISVLRFLWEIWHTINYKQSNDIIVVSLVWLAVTIMIILTVKKYLKWK